MDFLLIIHKKYEKNLFLEYIINNYSTEVLFYHTSDLESMSFDKITKYIHTISPKYILVDDYDFFYQSIQAITHGQLFLIKLDNRKIEFLDHKINLIVFNKYEGLTLQRLIPDVINELYSFDDFQVNYEKIDRSLLFILKRTEAMDHFLNAVLPEDKEEVSKKLRSFFENVNDYSFDYALKILLASSVELKNNISSLYESLVNYVNFLADLAQIEQQNFKVSVVAFNCDFLPYKYSFNSFSDDKQLELFSTNKIIILPKYESKQIETLINDVCKALFMGSYVFLHEENKIFIEHFSFKYIGFYNNYAQIPKLLGNVKLNPQEIRNNKRLILQFKNNQSAVVTKRFELFNVEKNDYFSYIKSYLFKDKYKLLNISFKGEYTFHLSNFIFPTLGYPEGMEVKNIVINNNDELIKNLSSEQPEKICFYNRKNINIENNSYLMETDIYYYSCDLENFDVNKPQRKNETYITSSTYLLEYFQSNNLQCILETSYEDYNIKSMPSKEIATYLYIYDNEREYKQIFEDELIDEKSKQSLAEYIADSSENSYTILHKKHDNQIIQSLFSYDDVLYSKFINKIIANHLNTQLSLLSSSIENLDIYANQIFLYSVMDSVKAFCNYKHDFETIVDFLKTIGEYKFFVYPPSLDNNNLTLLLTIVVSLKKTYVILPELLKTEIVKLGINADMFSFYSSNADIVNICETYKNDTSRNKAIELYLAEINLIKM